jgi:hypothetical protein
MKILDAQVDWREDVANDPRLQVLVDEIPERSELRFENEDELWVAIEDGYVEYFAWSGDGNDGGYSGRSFEITTVDGKEVTLKGPWSSRAGCVNLRSSGPVVDVRMTSEPDVFEQGHTFRSGTLTLSAAKQAIDIADDDAHFERVEKFDNDEPYWIPVREEKEVEPA